MMEIFMTLVVMFMLLLLKGFFSGSEIALVNADRVKLGHKSKCGDKGAGMALRLLQKPDVLLSTTLVGTNLSTIILTSVGTVLMIKVFGDQGAFYSLLVFTPLFLILGEIVPKSVYQQKSNELTGLIIYPLRYISFLFMPFVFFFSRLARLLSRFVVKCDREQTYFITREQISALVSMAERSSAMEVLGQEEIRRVIRFADTTVGEIMTPITEAPSVRQGKGMPAAIKGAYNEGFTRIPVYDGSASNIVGIVSLTVWDMLEDGLNKKNLAELMTPPLYISPLETLDQLFPALEQREDNMAVVVDEFGSSIGFVTLENIIEEVVGQIDVGKGFASKDMNRRSKIMELGDDVFLVDARTPISEVNESIGMQLPTAEFHTISGLVLGRMRRIPLEGESIVENGFRFIVDEATQRAIVRLLVEPIVEGEASIPHDGKERVTSAHFAGEGDGAS